MMLSLRKSCHNLDSMEYIKIPSSSDSGYPQLYTKENYMGLPYTELQKGQFISISSLMTELME